MTSPTEVAVPSTFASAALIKENDYKKLYEESIKDPEAFWAKQAEERLTWMKKWDKVKETSFESPVSIKWFEGAKLNVAVNCLDRHLPQAENRIAFTWEPDVPTEPTKKSLTVSFTLKSAVWRT